MAVTSWFVTGTDTGVGKTLVSAALLLLAAKQGHTTLGLKPVAAGCAQSAAGLRNEDAEQLLAASTMPGLRYADVNPVALEPAVAPHLASGDDQGIEIQPLLKHCQQQLDRGASFNVIEGAGGWLVPLDMTHTLADLARGLNLPVVLVVGMRLGCINHALLSAGAIRESGCRLGGWVASCLPPPMPLLDKNIVSLQQRLAAPLLGSIPALEQASPARAAHYLRLPGTV